MNIDIKKITGNISKRKAIYILGGIGILFLCMSFFSAEKKEAVPIAQSEVDYCVQIEERLEKILPGIVNVGKVDVMVTAKNYGEIIPAENKDNNEIIILNQKGGGEDIKIIEESYPEIQGVIIVAEGGKSDKVKNDLTEAIVALLGVEAHKIKVFERKSDR